MNQKNKNQVQPVIFETAYGLLLKEGYAGFLDNQTSKPAIDGTDIGHVYDNER